MIMTMMMAMMMVMSMKNKCIHTSLHLPIQNSVLQYLFLTLYKYDYLYITDTGHQLLPTYIKTSVIQYNTSIIRLSSHHIWYDTTEMRLELQRVIYNVKVCIASIIHHHHHHIYNYHYYHSDYPNSLESHQLDID